MQGSACMPSDKLVVQNPQKIQPPLMSRFVMFSAVLFFVILVAGSIAFMFSMRQIIRTNTGNELSQMLEIKRIKLETSVESEISLALMIADSPLIRSFFTNPYDPELKKIAFQEMAAYRRAFAANSIFWVNDADKLFYFNDDEPYVLDPEIPDNYWYRMTLYDTEVYNFNINYNPDLNVTNLWINVPVFDDGGKPSGMIGTGIELTTFLEMIYEDRSGNVDIYLFNSAGEITGTDDIETVASKISINEELSFVGADIITIAKNLDPGEMLTMDFPSGKIALCGIPLLEWYSTAIFYYSMDDYNNAMTVFFILTLIVIVFVLIIFNVFISRLLTPMRKSMEEAEAANRAKSAFLSTMSHEIRTPLNAILGITEIQLQNKQLDQSVTGGLEKVFASGNMLLNIINDILDLSKIESGKLELLPGKYEVASFIADTVQLNILRTGGKEIEFDLHMDENIPAYLFGDELRIKQIFNNLLSNAFKYTAKGTVKLTVSSKAVTDKDDEVLLVIEVSDTGQGMTKEQVARLFDAYARFNMEANRTTEGTGLGMSITRNLVHMMNGDITITSEPGKGSVFTVRLPQGKAGSGILGKEAAENLNRFRTSDMAHLRRAQFTSEPMPYGSVLIVDDVETNLFVAKGLMNPYDLRIDTVDSGFGAIEKIKKGNVYDIIFMDHMMPKMDGMEATKILREMGYDQPVIALTANAVAGQSEIFLGNGFDDFISKPIDIRRLNAILNKHIRDKQKPEVIEKARARAKAQKPQIPDLLAQPEIKRRFTEFFLRDAHRSIAVLDAFVEKGMSCNEEEIRTFVIHIHGMKSALANMGRTDISDIALKLEILGRENNIEALAIDTPVFLNSLKAYVNELSPNEETVGEITGVDDKQYLTEKLLRIKAACGDFDASIVDDVLAELKKAAWPKQIKELLDKIDGQLLYSDFDEIADGISKFIDGQSEVP